MLTRRKTRRALTHILDNPDHQHFSAIYRALADRAWGKPAASLIVGNAPNAVETYLLQRAQQKRMQQALATAENGDRDARTFRVVTEVPGHRLTPHERRAMLARELAEFATDAGMTELAEQLRQASAELAAPHPVDAREFTFEIDQPTDIVVKREVRSIDGRTVEPSAPTPAPAPRPATDQDASPNVSPPPRKAGDIRVSGREPAATPPTPTFALA